MVPGTMHGTMFHCASATKGNKIAAEFPPPGKGQFEIVAYISSISQAVTFAEDITAI